MLRGKCLQAGILAFASILFTLCLTTDLSSDDRDIVKTLAPECGQTEGSAALPKRLTTPSGSTLCDGWPVNLNSPGAGFPYTPTLYDADRDGADEIFLTGGNTFALRGDGTFMPGWPTTEMQYMGYGTNANKPGPSIADLNDNGDFEVLWSGRDWWAGSSNMWCFNGKNIDGSNMPGYPQRAIDDNSNALDTPFVLGDTDGDGDLEAWAAHTLGNTFVHYRISAFDHLGNRLFTTDLDTSENIISLYFGDLDGDSTSEMFAVSLLSNSFRLHVFDAYGNETAGYPVTLYTMSSEYNMFGPPIPADLNSDGDLEILLGTWGNSGSYARCFHHDGEPCMIFPIQIATDSQLFYLGLGDITGDGFPELLALENHLPGNYRAFAIDIPTSTPLDGWPFEVPDWPHGFPSVVDVDDDRSRDVCFSTDGGEVYAVSGQGELIEGYPKLMLSPSISSVAVGDIDSDGLYELVAATWDGWVYAWDTPSTVSPDMVDWPMRGVNVRNTGVYGDIIPPPDPVLVEMDDSSVLLPKTMGLSQNFPNPFNPATVISYEVRGTPGDPRHTSLTVYDLRGRRVRTLTSTRLEPGLHTIMWNGTDDRGAQVPSGVYFYVLKTGVRTLTRKMLLER